MKHKDKHIARLLAVQYIYSREINEKENLETVFFEPNAILDELEEPKYDTRLYEELVDGAERFKKEIDKVISKFATAWPIDQIILVNVTILRIAIFEAFIAKKTPIKIVINEAIELNKELTTNTSSNFINGVLGALLKDDETLEYLSNLFKVDGQI